MRRKGHGRTEGPGRTADTDPGSTARPDAAAEGTARHLTMDGDGPTEEEASANGPIIMLSYPHSGARLVQDLLATGTKLACTAGTGILPLCAAATETWQRVEGGGRKPVSRLAVVSVRSLITTQVTAILSSTGQKRWCELATADPSAAQHFLQIFPDVAFISVHRNCPDVIHDWVSANPWGLRGQGITPFVMSYPGNTIAALAAYWANATQELLTFEDAHLSNTHRVRYEDTAGDSGDVISPLQAWLDLPSAGDTASSNLCNALELESQAVSEAEVPVEMIPEPLQKHISRLQARLGYPLLPS